MTLREIQPDNATPWVRYLVFADHFGHGPFWRFGWTDDRGRWHCGIDYKISPPIKAYELPPPPEGFENPKYDLAQLLPPKPEE